MAIEHEVETTGLVGWIDRRFPLTSTWKKHVSEYYAPKNFNFWYFFGSLALLVLVNQIVTGIFLTMNYKPDATLAFSSVEYIMREVPWGWLIRYMHSTGASMFFVVVYLHMFRGLMYGSYRKPRELVWVFGCAIFLCLMAEAFFGYLLPWGQMSFWGAQVIVNLFSAIPFIGPDLSLWIRGDYVVSDVTLNRFFAFHVIAIPLVLIGLVVAHLVALHEVGSNNPDGIEIKAKKDPDGIPLDGIPFHPYYSVHDFMGVSVFLFIFAAIIFFAPEMGGYFLEANNFIPANPLQTPQEIAPVWYFTAFYAMLRATTDQFKYVLMIAIAALGLLALVRAHGKWKLGLPVLAVLVILAMAFTESKFWGVVVMGGAVISLFFLPWLDRSPVKSIRYRPFFHKVFYGIFVVVFLTLGFLGTKPPSPASTLIAQICALIYFAFFLGMPFWTRLGTFKQPPERVRFKPH
ncbi:cytochrome bc complex cytochrome b subunit [Paraburkholderia bryophila]|jgi:ubiquinol-cytochrome c reductase cytochrome b subunit|uniref:Cytochrome b n=1 Tax=Paraburkholderia bryophila TaxID=420952 RepID=A0A329BZ44_9BURK|nr:cytochrome bc complex cytochrome b subunit [Paraburkholderia bryophila]RAS27180.1 ubiquinol-cytochrome c reductase cytochrome b subunit [Paraburkholderia bryophila]WCM19471.1 cytochrome bc complex cytochrome b subunit [Paraburkholderia bryophila]